VHYQQSMGLGPLSQPLRLPRDNTLPRVDIVLMHADAPPDIIEHVANAGARAIVIAGVGNGNMPRKVLAAVRRAIRAGIIVVRCSRTDTGFVSRNVEIPDDRVGTLAGGSLSPSKARVLLQLWLLRKRRDVEQLQRVMLSCW